MTRITDALVLTAGLGTRLRPLTLVRAKPAIPLAGEPMARRIARTLAAQAVVNQTYNLHHLPHTLTAVLGDGSDLGARIRYSWEHPVVLGSAGGPRRALDIVGAQTFFLVNGDTLTDVALQPVADAHQRSGALVTLALVPNTEPDKYGGVLLAADGAVTGFDRRGAAAGSFHLIGVQVVNRDAFVSLSPDEPASSIGGLYDQLIAERPGSVRGTVVDANFWDIGSVADYWATSQAMSQGASVSGHGDVHPSAQVSRAILWDDVKVEEGAIVEACIVTDGVCVPRGAVYRRSILRAAGGGIEVSALPEDAR